MAVQRFTRQQYLTYLNSPRWRNFRRYAIRKAKGVCERCGGTSPNGAVDVHHLHYENFGRERLNDVIVLCRHCHDEADQERHYISRVRGWARKCFGERWFDDYTFDEVSQRFEAWLAKKGLS